MKERTEDQITQDMIAANKEMMCIKEEYRENVDNLNETLRQLRFELKVQSMPESFVDETEILFTLRQGFATRKVWGRFSSDKELLIWARALKKSDIVYADISEDCPEEIRKALRLLSTFLKVRVREDHDYKW